MDETEVQPDPPTVSDDAQTPPDHSETADQASPAEASRPSSEEASQPTSEEAAQPSLAEADQPVLTLPEQLVAPVMVPRWVQMILLPLALLGLWELGHAMGTLLVIVVAAGVIAVILNPLAKHFQRVVPRAL